MPLGEVFQDGRTIVADGCDLNSVIFKPLFGILQLRELRFADGSPIRGAEEEKNRAVRSAQRLV